MRKTCARISMVAIVLTFALVSLGCAPTLRVQHLDWSTPEAVVWLDGEQVGTVTYGDSFEIDIKEGQHRLRATRPGETSNPWHRTGADWIVVALEDVVLTLLPEPGSKGRP